MRRDFVVRRSRRLASTNVDAQLDVVRHVEMHEIRTHVAIIGDPPLFQVERPEHVTVARMLVPGHRDGPGLSFDQRDEKTSRANALGPKTRLAYDIPFSR